MPPGLWSGLKRPGSIYIDCAIVSWDINNSFSFWFIGTVCAQHNWPVQGLDQPFKYRAPDNNSRKHKQGVNHHTSWLIHSSSIKPKDQKSLHPPKWKGPISHFAQGLRCLSSRKINTLHRHHRPIWSLKDNHRQGNSRCVHKEVPFGPFGAIKSDRSISGGPSQSYTFYPSPDSL